MKEVFDMYCLIMLMVMMTIGVIGGIVYIIKHIREEEGCDNEQYAERIEQLEQALIDAECRCEELQMELEQIKNK